MDDLERSNDKGPKSKTAQKKNSNKNSNKNDYK